MEIKAIIQELITLKAQMIKCSECLAELNDNTELDFTKQQSEQLKQSSDLIQTWISGFEVLDNAYNEYNQTHQDKR